MSNQPLAQPAALGTEVGDNTQVHPVFLKWCDVCYTVQEKKRGEGVKDKPILQQISGQAEPGSFTAIIGASGSGKTSLLSALADRLLLTKGAKLTGELLLNGEAAPDDYRRRCAFVQQVEVFYPFSTVRETVEMAARMRLGRNISVQEKQKRAAAVIRQLGLSKAVDTQVGDGARIKGISGGEMKRVGIACELVSSPSLVLLDEPTSGLDSNAALNVVKGLKDLALSGRTIIASVHQPGSALFELFDKLVVLAEGRQAYFGPAGGTIEHFSKIGYKCPAMFNPADYMLQITSIDYSTEESETESRKALDKIHSSATGVVEEAIPRQLSCGPGPAIENQTSYLEQFTLLYKRIFLDAVRNKVAIIIKLVQGLVTTLLMIVLYGNMNDAKVVSVIEMNTTALIFFITISGLFGPLFGTIQAFAPEVSIVLRERMNNLYSVAPYYMAKLLVAIPVELGPLFIQNTISFWALQFKHSVDRYLVFLLFTCGMAFASIGIGFLLAVAAGGNVQAASAGVAPIALLFLLLGGFYINTSTIPVWIRWFSKIEYIRFVYEGLAINQFNGGLVTADGVHAQADGTCPPGTDAGKAATCAEGTTVLNNLFNNGAVKTEHEWSVQMWTYVAFILISILVFNFLAYSVLLMKGPKYLKMEKIAAIP
jgi:ABC-type multidrug transport system ATPase subunit